MEKTTITIDGDTLDRFKERKDELDDAQPDVPDHSANSFLNALLDTWERDDHDAPVPVDLRGDGDDMPTGFEGLLEADKEDIEELKKMIDRVPERTAERTADQLEGRFR